MTARRKVLIVLTACIALWLGLPLSGAVSTASAQVQVSSAIPDTGEQGTLSLNVTIKGRGFKNGATVKFFKTKTKDPAGIVVNGTQFVNDTELVANIDIADTAAVAGFDIVVQNADGRTGKGTELFSVVAKGNSPAAYEAEFIAVNPDDPAWVPAIRDDGKGPYGVTLKGGGFQASIDAADERRVWFKFGDPNRTFESTIGCEAWGSLAPYSRPTPWYLLTSDKTVLPDYVGMFTTSELTWDSTVAKWVRIVVSQRRNDTTYKSLDLLNMGKGQKSYGMLVFYFRVRPSPNNSYLNFNDTFYRELVPSGTSMRLNGGIVEIERPSEEEVWYVRPISSRFPVLGTPPTATVEHQANHAIYDTEGGGNCDLGNYLMKFELRIARK